MYHRTDTDGDTSMILTNLSNREKVSSTYIRKVLSFPYPYSTQVMKELTIDEKMHRKVNTIFSMCIPTTAHIFNHILTAVLMYGVAG